MNIMKIVLFFIILCYLQTYQIYAGSRQKLAEFLENKVFLKSKFSEEIFDKSLSPSLVFFKELFF